MFPLRKKHQKTKTNANMASWLNISSIKDNISNFTREVLTEAGNDTFNTSAGESDGEEGTVVFVAFIPGCKFFTLFLLLVSFDTL